MYATRSSLLATALAALMLASASPSPAYACSPPSPTVRLAGNEVAFDGLLWGEISYCPECTTGAIRVVDVETRQQVIGTVHPLAGTSLKFAFRPSAPLVVGKMYRIELEAVDSQSSTIFIPITRGAQSDLTVSVMARQTSRGRDLVRCEQYDSIAGLCEAPSFYAGTERGALLSLSLSGVSATEASYRVVWSADGQTVANESGLLAPTFGYAFFQRVHTLCYELFAVDPVSGSERRVSGECKPADPSWFGSSEGSSGDVTGTLRSCLRPPEGYQDLWCKAFEEDPCFSAACSNARAMCPSRGGKDAGTVADLPEEDASSSSAQDHAAGPSRDDGCSVGAGGSGASLSSALMLSLGWVVFRRRRRQLRST